ncbi:MAG: trigger factor [Halothiobacillaceae bacterium]
MQVTLETAEGLLRRLSVQVPAAQVEEAVEQRLKDLARRVRMDGFRPGKAPLPVVRLRYGEQVRDEVVGDLIQRTYMHAVTEQKLYPASSPRITKVDMIAGEGLHYVAEIEVYPEITLADPSVIAIEHPKVEISEADVDTMIENLRKQRITYNTVERAAAEGDRVIVDFKGNIDGEPFDGGSVEDMSLELGKGMLLKDLEASIVGMKAGESKAIEVTVPEDYHVKHLAGKKVNFDVTVKSVAEPILPEVDDAFCAAFGVKEGGVETLRSEVRKNMERELARSIKRRLKQQVMDGLLAINEVLLPKALVEQEAQTLRGQFSQPLPLDVFTSEAERRVKLGLIVAALVKDQGLKVDAARVDALLDDIAASYEDPAEVKAYYKSRPELMQNLEAMAIEDLVVEHVLAKAKVTDKPMSFNEAVKSAVS